MVGTEVSAARGADVRATYVLSGLDLDPSAITMTAGIEPTRALRRGDPIHGGRRAAREGSWEVTAERLAVFGADEVLADLLEALKPGWSALMELGRTTEAHVRVGVDVHDTIPSLFVARDVGQALAALNACLDFDVHADLARGAESTRGVTREKAGFADAIWDSMITTCQVDLLTMSLHVATEVESSLGIDAHQLSLVGISRLAVQNRLGLPITVAEIREFGVLVNQNKRLSVSFEVSDQIGFEIECESAVFDGIALQLVE